MTRQQITSTLSIGLAVVFCLWLALDIAFKKSPSSVPPVVKEQVEKTEEPDQAEKDAAKPALSAQTVLVLPAPPKPAPAPVATTAPAPVPTPALVLQAAPVPLAKVDPAPPPAPAVVEMTKPAPQTIAAEPPKAPIAKQAPVVPLKPVQVATPTPEVTVTADTINETSEGRTLLRVLEHGKGPVIEIAWPSGAAAQRALYATFVQCFDMKVALMNGQGDLFIAEGKARQRWEINLDRYSGFLRQAHGSTSQEEQNQVRAIDRFHRGLNGADVVRIFPRLVDARLLGGLKALVGDGYLQSRSIHALYRLEKDKEIGRAHV